MNLLQLQEILIEFTESEGFVSLESFRDEFLNSALEGFEQFVTFREDSYSSKTLFRTEKFEIRLLCWKPFQQTPIHPHPQNGCLMKILEGKLAEEKFAGNNKIETVYKKGDVGYIKASELHILKNAETDSISLHIYSPGGFYDMLN
jgi:predicted metal-dependent enzyme (double-stranded beta helix superfamily)